MPITCFIRSHGGIQLQQRMIAASAIAFPAMDGKRVLNGFTTASSAGIVSTAGTVGVVPILPGGATIPRPPSQYKYSFDYANRVTTSCRPPLVMQSAAGAAVAELESGKTFQSDSLPRIADDTRGVPVSEHVHLTSLILQDLATYSSIVRRHLSGYESLLCDLALSGGEASNVLVKCLAVLATELSASDVTGNSSRNLRWRRRFGFNPVPEPLYKRHAMHF
ncbi:hypothetical protein Aperf_G00000015678 [Anoplocephala perfoliata]